MVAIKLILTELRKGSKRNFNNLKPNRKRMNTKEKEAKRNHL